jgi:deazaflavin-dependent oxidoreductase (nitroreductase family)
MWKLILSLMVSLYRMSGGRIGGKMGQTPVLLLTTTGRKSGKQRTLPLIYIRDGDAYVITASAGGSPRHPGWFFNLRSNPQVTIQVQKTVLPATAEVASPEKRSELWPRLVHVSPGFAAYEKRAEGREIPMVLVRPTNDAS